MPAWLSREVRPSCSKRPLWPVPPPLWRWTGNPRPGPKQRKRKRANQLKSLLLQRVICMLNWITLGYPDKPTADAQAGVMPTGEQEKVIETLQNHIAHFCDLPNFSREDLGRFGEKFVALHSSLEELPAHQEVDLGELLQAISHQFDSYATFEAPHLAEESQHEAQHENCQHDPAFVPIKDCGNKPVVASRIKWKHPPKFDPRPYLLDPIVASVFDNPDSLRLPSSLWPNKPKARVQCSRGELLGMMKIWDAHGSLALFPCDEIDPHEAVGIFAVPKDEHFDRLIINPTVLNSRLMPYSKYTKKLAPEALLSLLSLGPQEAFRFCADDLSDFYYTFKVPRNRAKRNCIGMKVYPSEVHELSCYDSTQKGPFYPALNTLAMGDGHAVEIAQGSHHALLQIEAGCMREPETLEYRKAIPRGDFIELLAIDDHIGVQKIPIQEVGKPTDHRDTQVFDQSQRAYSKVGLVAHPGKARRRESKGTILGADFDGVRGRVSAPRIRLFMLIWLTSTIVKLGTCTRQILTSILGCWIHAILFRRPLLALIDCLFKEGFDRKPHEVFCLSSHARHDLMSLCILGSCAQTDLRAKICPKIYALDASPSGAGIVQAESTSVAVAELWRHSEQRGYHTNLLGPAAATLKELGYDSVQDLEMGAEAPELQVFPQSDFRLPTSLAEGFLYDCVELFRGSGNWASCHVEHGLFVHEGFEQNRSKLFFKDLANDSTFHEVMALAHRRVVREWQAGPPCLTYGTLRRPRLRDVNHPEGFNPHEPLTAAHNLLARRVAMVGAIAILTGVYFSCEQPGSSVMFRLHCFKVLVQLGCVITRMAFCNFGSAFNKPSQWLHNKGWLLQFEGSCRCKWKNQHFVVQGNFTPQSIEAFDRRCVPDACTVYGKCPEAGERVSSYSARYPVSLMRRMALGSQAAKEYGSPIIPLSARLVSFARVGLPVPENASFLYDPSIDDEVVPRPWYEDPEWISELANSLEFRTLFKYRFKSSNHINVLETRVYLSWLKHCAKQHRDSRVLGLQDSRVALGAAAKGRSSSYAISRVLKQAIPYILGSNLYPGGLHVYSGDNRADAPSRDNEVLPPSRPLPQWYLDLEKGDYRQFDLICQSARFPRLLGRWVRLLLLLAGDVERNPGPKNFQHTSRPERGELDMTVGFCKATSNRMSRCLAAFAMWVGEEMKMDVDAILADSQGTCLALRAYGMHLFRSGFPRYMYVYTLTAIQDQFPQHRPFLSSAWHIDRKWQVAEPGKCRPVLSLATFKAVLALALLWRWWRWAAVTMIGFAGMLHPSEFLFLKRRNLMLPRDTNFHISVLYVHLTNPKTYRFARQQHVKVDGPDIISFVDAVFGDAALDSRLYDGSLGMYRNQWNAIMKRFGIPYLQIQHGLTPGTLRGSGATALYLMTEDIPLICWRGRWSRVKTLEFYLQEVAAQVMEHNLSASSRKMISDFCTACNGLFFHILHEVRKGAGPR